MTIIIIITIEYGVTPPVHSILYRVGAKDGSVEWIRRQADFDRIIITKIIHLCTLSQEY